MPLKYKILICVIVGFVAVTFYSTQQQFGSVASCQAQMNGQLPDPGCTPGAINSNITQTNLTQTLCNPSWSTKSIRPSSSYTTKLKIQQIAQYGYSDTNPASYEEDHLISLELGGNPNDPKNLWPEAYPVAKEKDQVENNLHKQICAGTITLDAAQKAISKNWMQLKTFGDTSSYTDEDDN